MINDGSLSPYETPRRTTNYFQTWSRIVKHIPYSLSRKCDFRVHSNSNFSHRLCSKVCSFLSVLGSKRDQCLEKKTKQLASCGIYEHTEWEDNKTCFMQDENAHFSTRERYFYPYLVSLKIVCHEQIKLWVSNSLRKTKIFWIRTTKDRTPMLKFKAEIREHLI